MSSKTKFLAIPVVTLSCFAVAWLSQILADDAAKTTTPKVVSPVVSELDRDLFVTRNQRRDLVTRAIAKLEELRSDERTTGDYLLAIRVLEEFHAKDGIEILSKQLLYEPEGFSSRPTYNYFPATFALISIGPPAVPAMLKVIRDPDRTEIERRIACWVLLNIEASFDPDLQPDNPLVKLAVMKRLEQLQYVKDSEGPAVETAWHFLHGFAETEGRWQEIPEIQESSFWPAVEIGAPIRHRLTCKKPMNHPEATIKFGFKVQFELNDEVQDRLELKFHQTGELTGELTGMLKEPGDYWITVGAIAEWTNEAGMKQASYGAKAFQLQVREPQAKNE